jgi:DNA-binding XRE family transcriptional regulator
VNQLAYGLRRTRIESGMSMRQMASVLGVAPSTISRLEPGERVAGRWNPAHVALDLGLPADELLRPCPHCHYAPPAGYLCLRCGSAGRQTTERKT